MSHSLSLVQTNCISATIPRRRQASRVGRTQNQKMGNNQGGGHESANGSPRVVKSDSTDSGMEPLSKEEMEERFAELVVSMPTP